MHEFSDSTNTFFIMFIMFMFYLFLRFRQTELKLRKNMGEINCNPLEMMIGSFMNEEQANKTFAACMEYSTAENIAENQQQKKNEFKKEVGDLMGKIRESQGDNETQSRIDRSNLYADLLTKSSDIEETIAKQKSINETILQSSPNIENIVKRIGDISGKIKNIFEKINE